MPEESRHQAGKPVYLWALLSLSAFSERWKKIPETKRVTKISTARAEAQAAPAKGYC